MYVSYHLARAGFLSPGRLSIWVFIWYNLGGDVMFTRLIPLIGNDNLEKIKNAKILLVGVGGVGGFTLEALVRSGFNNITIVDGDTIEESNLNRQIIATKSNISKRKTEEALNRCLSINSDINIKTIDKMLTKDNFSKYINEDYDYIIDACDDLNIKVTLIKYAKTNNIKIISALGTGKKLNPKYLEITSLAKTENDPLARKLRSMVRKENLDLDIPVIFSKETSIDTKNIIGSCIFVPAVAGIYLANYVFLDIIKPQDNS